MLQFLVRLRGAAAPPPFRGGAGRSEAGARRAGAAGPLLGEGRKVAVCGHRLHPRPPGGSGEARRAGGRTAFPCLRSWRRPLPSAPRCVLPPRGVTPPHTPLPPAVKLLKRGDCAQFGLSGLAASRWVRLQAVSLLHNSLKPSPGLWSRLAGRCALKRL